MSGESEFKPWLKETEKRDAVQYEAPAWLLKKVNFLSFKYQLRSKPISDN